MARVVKCQPTINTLTLASSEPNGCHCLWHQFKHATCVEVTSQESLQRKLVQGCQILKACNMSQHQQVSVMHQQSVLTSHPFQHCSQQQSLCSLHDNHIGMCMYITVGEYLGHSVNPHVTKVRKIDIVCCLYQLPPISIHTRS